MTEVAAAPATPAAGATSDASAPLSSNAFSRLSLEEQGQYAHVKKPDGDGSHWVRRDSLPPDTPSSTSSLSRPAWVPESAWDPATGFNHEKFDQYFRETVEPALTRDAAEQVRRNTLPQKSDDYKVEVSKAFQLPPGDELVLDANDPFWSRAKDLAHRTGLSQEAFSKAVDLIAARDSITRAHVTRARDAELGKLGPTAQGRLNAIEAFYKDLVGEAGATQAMSRIWTAADVVRAEKVVARFKGQGGSVTRTEPGLDDATWAAMSPSERYNWAKSHSTAPR